MGLTKAAAALLWVHFLDVETEAHGGAETCLEVPGTWPGAGSWGPDQHGLPGPQRLNWGTGVPGREQMAQAWAPCHLCPWGCSFLLPGSASIPTISPVTCGTATSLIWQTGDNLEVPLTPTVDWQRPLVSRALWGAQDLWGTRPSLHGYLLGVQSRPAPWRPLSAGDEAGPAKMGGKCQTGRGTSEAGAKRW